MLTHSGTIAIVTHSGTVFNITRSGTTATTTHSGTIVIVTHSGTMSMTIHSGTVVAVIRSGTTAATSLFTMVFDMWKFLAATPILPMYRTPKYSTERTAAIRQTDYKYRSNRMQITANMQG